MAIIESAGVQKNGMLVDKEGRGQVFAATEGEDRHINQTSGKVWSAPFTITTTANDAYIAYMKNTGSKNLHVTDVRMTNTGVASVVTFDYVTGVPANTDPVVPLSRNLGNPVEVDADTLQSLDGAGIADLVTGGLVFPKFSKSNDELHLRTTSNIIIPPGQAFAIKIATLGGVYLGSISVVEVEVETGAR